ncbi:hypothetical protein C4564_05180 [Candidatus Microgenomates bacterium]|nr:MAG: hypothetical protein C4564_05180 [Candidatus Microgenomates bacterium]
MFRTINVALPPCYPADHPEGPQQLVQSVLGDDIVVRVIYANVKKVQFSGIALSPDQRNSLVEMFTVNDKKPIFSV